MKIAFEVDARLIVVTSIAGVVGLFALHAAYPGLFGFWPTTSQDLASWVQAVGAVAAILGALWIASSQERAQNLKTKQAAVKKARSALAGVEFVAEQVLERRTSIRSDVVSLRMLAGEYLEVARSVDAEALSLEWITQIYGLRVAAVRLFAALQKFEDSPVRPGQTGIVEQSHVVALLQEVADIRLRLGSIHAVLVEKHPGVAAYD